MGVLAPTVDGLFRSTDRATQCSMVLIITVRAAVRRVILILFDLAAAN